jgi:hypothetical protein
MIADALDHVADTRMYGGTDHGFALPESQVLLWGASWMAAILGARGDPVNPSAAIFCAFGVYGKIGGFCRYASAYK